MSFFNSDSMNININQINEDSFSFLGTTTVSSNDDVVDGTNTNTANNNNNNNTNNNNDFSFTNTLNNSFSSFASMFNNTTNFLTGLTTLSNSTATTIDPITITTDNTNNNNNNINNNMTIDQQQIQSIVQTQPQQIYDQLLPSQEQELLQLQQQLQQQQQTLALYQDPQSPLYIQPITNNNTNNSNNIFVNLNNYATQMNNVAAYGGVVACQEQIYQQQSVNISDCSSPDSNFSPTSQVPSSPNHISDLQANTNSGSLVAVPSPSASVQSEDENLLDSSESSEDDEEDDSSSDGEKQKQRPVKKRKNSFDPNHDYGHLLPKQILLNISSKQFVAYRQKFYPSTKISKEVSNTLKNQERKIKNRESAQKSRAKKTKFVEELEDQLKEANDRISKLEEENKRLKYELHRPSSSNNNNSNNNSSCSSSSTMVSFSPFTNPFSIGPVATSSGQRLACFFIFVLFISSIIISSNPFSQHAFTNPTGSRSAFGNHRMNQLGLPGSRVPLTSDFFSNDQTPLFSKHLNNNGKLEITLEPSLWVLKNVENNQKKRKIYSEEDLIDSEINPTTSTMSSTTTNPVVSAPRASDVCDITELPVVNNSSVRISYRTTQKTEPEHTNDNHQSPMDLVQDVRASSPIDVSPKTVSVQYKDLQFDVNLVFPTQLFKNSSNVSKLLLSNDGRPIEITASVIDVHSSAGSSSPSSNSQQTIHHRED